MLSICGFFVCLSHFGVLFLLRLLLWFSVAEAVRSPAEHFASFNFLLNDHQRLWWESQGLESLSYEENRVTTTLGSRKLVKVLSDPMHPLHYQWGKLISQCEKHLIEGLLWRWSSIKAMAHSHMTLLKPHNSGSFMLLHNVDGCRVALLPPQVNPLVWQDMKPRQWDSKALPLGHAASLGENLDHVRLTLIHLGVGDTESCKEPWKWSLMAATVQSWFSFVFFLLQYISQLSLLIRVLWSVL